MNIKQICFSILLLTASSAIFAGPKKPFSKRGQEAAAAATEPLVQSDDDQQKEPASSVDSPSSRRLSDEKLTASPAISPIAASLAKIQSVDDTWDMASVPAELRLKETSNYEAFWRKLQATKEATAQAWRKVAKALELTSALDAVDFQKDPMLLATTLATANLKKLGSGTTLAAEAIREAIERNDTPMLDSLTQACSTLDLIKDFGQTDRASIKVYYDKKAAAVAEALKEETEAAARSIQSLAHFSRIIAPSGRSTPPATDEKLEALSAQTAERILTDASAGRFTYPAITDGK